MNPFDAKEDPEKLIDPLDAFLSTDLPPLAVSPDGSARPGIIGEPFKIPDATPENFICLRGPCRNYFETQMVFGVGNTRDSLETEPILIKRMCTRVAGLDFDLTDECIKKCSDWSPYTEAELNDVAARQDNFYQRFPQFKPNGKGA